MDKIDLINIYVHGLEGVEAAIDHELERIAALEAEVSRLREEASFNDIEELDRPLPHPPLSTRMMLLVDPRRIAELEAEVERLREACGEIHRRVVQLQRDDCLSQSGALRILGIVAAALEPTP